MSISSLIAILGILMVLALRAPPHFLLAVDLLLVAYSPGQWHLAGVMFDPSDLVFAFLLASVALNPRSWQSLQRIPYLGLWFLLGAVLSLSYVASPLSSEYMTDPARVTYQLYRYAWKPILYYPLAAMLLSEVRPARIILFTLIATGALCALQSIPQGYSGLRAGGPFGIQANALGAVLTVPIVLSTLMLLVASGSLQLRAILVGVLLLLARGILFTGSRGAIAATVAGCGIGALLLTVLPKTRYLMMRIGGPAVLGAAILLLIPGALERPTLKRALSVTEGTSAETLRWRLEERWPHFLQEALENPYLGTGTEIDPSLGIGGNTPHNGYIAIAAKRGFPAAVIYLIFAFLGIRNSLRLIYTRRPNRWGAAIGIICAASISAILVHNIVESLFEFPFIAKVFWIYVALASVAATSIARVAVSARAYSPGVPVRAKGPAPVAARHRA